MCPSSQNSNWLPPLFSLALLPPPWLLTSATVTAWAWSTAAMLWRCSAPSSPLLRLHVQTLRPRLNAGKRPPYTMRAARLRLVKHA